MALGAAALLFASALAGCKGQGSEPQRAVASVNSHEITYSQYRDALKRLVPINSTESMDDLAEIKKDLVNRLIEEELIIEEAGRRGITVSDAEVSTEVEGLKDEYGDDSFKDAIEERYGTFENWKERIRRKLLIRKTIDSVTGSVKPATDSQARAYYKEHAADYKLPERVRARMIVVADLEEARKIRATLTPANFAEVAREKSLSPEKVRGGDLGFFARGQMPQEFEDVVFKLRPGQISRVVKTDYGYHIFLLEEKKKAGEQSYSEVSDRIKETIRQDSQDALFSDWMKSLKLNAKIKVREDLL